MIPTEPMLDVCARLDALDPEARATAIGAFGREPAATDTEAEAKRLNVILDALAAGGGNLEAIEAVASAAPFGDFAADPGDVPLTSGLLRDRIKALTDMERATFVDAWQASGLTMALAVDGEDVALSSEDYKAVEALLAEHEPRPIDDEMRTANGALIGALSRAERDVLECRLAAIGIDPANLRYFSTVGRQYAVNRMASMWADELAANELAANAADAEARVATLPALEAEPTAITRVPVADEADLANAIPEKATMAELLEWVGNDKARATKAIAAEGARSKPRKGVVARCNVVVATFTEEPEHEGADVIDIVTGKEPVTEEQADTNAADATSAVLLARLFAIIDEAAAIIANLGGRG